MATRFIAVSFCCILICVSTIATEPQQAETSSVDVKSSESLVDGVGTVLGGTLQQILGTFTPVLQQLQAVGPNFLQGGGFPLQPQLLNLLPAAIGAPQIIPQQTSRPALRGLSEAVIKSATEPSKPPRTLYHGFDHGYHHHGGDYGYPYGGYGGYGNSYGGFGYGGFGGFESGFGGGFYGGYYPDYYSGWY